MRNILLALVMLSGTWLAAQQTLKPPVTWDEAALREWATPIAGLNVRPGHFSSEEYLKAPVDNLRTYPVYFPGREPAGYWDMLQSVGPKPLIEPAALTSDADWVRAGQRVFDEFDVATFRVVDPQVVAFARSSAGVREFAGQTASRRHAARPAMDSHVQGRRARAGELRTVPHTPDARRHARPRRTSKRDTVSDWTLPRSADGAHRQSSSRATRRQWSCGDRGRHPGSQMISTNL